MQNLGVFLDSEDRETIKGNDPTPFSFFDFLFSFFTIIFKMHQDLPQCAYFIHQGDLGTYLSYQLQ